MDIKREKLTWPPWRMLENQIIILKTGEWKESIKHVSSISCPEDSSAQPNDGGNL